jgi:hypothetical protein
LVLVFEDLDAQPVGRVHIGLIEATIRPGLHRHTGGLPLGYLLLHIVYDEADVVHHGSDRWTIRRRRSRRLIQRDDDAGKHHAMEAASREGFASHADKNLLIGGNVLGIKMPMTVGQPASLNGNVCAAAMSVVKASNKQTKIAFFMDASLD